MSWLTCITTILQNALYCRRRTISLLDKHSNAKCNKFHCSCIGRIDNVAYIGTCSYGCQCRIYWRPCRPMLIIASHSKVHTQTSPLKPTHAYIDLPMMIPTECPSVQLTFIPSSLPTACLHHMHHYSLHLPLHTTQGTLSPLQLSSVMKSRCWHILSLFSVPLHCMLVCRKFTSLTPGTCSQWSTAYPRPSCLHSTWLLLIVAVQFLSHTVRQVVLK